MIICHQQNFIKILFIIFCATSLVAQSALVPRNKITAACTIAATVAIGARGAVEHLPEYHGILKCWPTVFVAALGGVVAIDRVRTGGWYLLREIKEALGFGNGATRAVHYAADVNTEFACGDDEDFFGLDDDGDDECAGGCCCCH